jgi:hypothetical protein
MGEQKGGYTMHYHKKIFLVVLSFTLLLPFVNITSGAFAEQSGKWSARDVNCALKIQSAEVPGSEAHSMYLMEGKGISFTEREGAIPSVIIGVMDYKKGEGPANGYTAYTFPDGSTIRTRWDAMTRPGGAGVAGGSAGELRWSFVEGTGKFQGIQGGGRGEYWILAPGQWYVDFDGNYTIP